MKNGMKALALVAGIGACNMALAASYTITDLGTLGGSSSAGSAINNAGEVTGWSYDASGSTRAFVYRNGIMTDLGTLGGESSWGTAINDTGQVTGYATTASGAGRAFLYSNGTMTDIGTLGGVQSWGNGINNLGQITGWAQASSGAGRAFLYSDGVMTDLGTLNESWGNAINNAGYVTGWTHDASGAERAFLYRDGTLTDLGGLVGGERSEGTAINDAGQVTVQSSDASFNFSRAFIYHDGAITDLGPSVGGLGINNAGQVVGVSEGIGAALYSNGTVVDLSTLIPPDSGWLLGQPTDINDAGQITGYGFIDINKDGVLDETHAYLLTPIPIPAAVWLLGSGLLGLAGMSFAQRRARRGESGEIVA